MMIESDARALVESIAARPTMKQADDYEQDGILYCGKCRQPRQAWIDWFPDKDGNKTKNLVRIMCRCDEEKEREEKERKAQADFGDAMRTVKLVFQIKRDDVRWRFEMDDSSDSPIARTCRRYVDQWSEMREKNIGILFYGNKGIGKTFYASCIYNALKDRNVLVGFTTAPNLMNILGKWDKTEIYNAVKNVQMLVIDDLGAERGSEYAGEMMYSVIDARYKTGKPTIVTTNIDLADMEAESDLWRSRIYDRVIEMCPITLKMTGNSRRSGIADDRKKMAREILSKAREG